MSRTTAKRYPPQRVEPSRRAKAGKEQTVANISQAFYRDLVAARKAQRQAQAAVIITRLTKAGVPSKMAEDTHYFKSWEEADAYVANLRELNPGKVFKFTIRVA